MNKMTFIKKKTLMFPGTFAKTVTKPLGSDTHMCTRKHFHLELTLQSRHFQPYHLDQPVRTYLYYKGPPAFTHWSEHISCSKIDH